MARVQAACKLIDLLPSEFLRTKGVLPCGHQDLADAIDGCSEDGEDEGARRCGGLLMSRPRRRRFLDVEATPGLAQSLWINGLGKG
jgi:hypothetical protein